MSGQPLRLRLRASMVLTLLTIGMHALSAAVLWSVLPRVPGIAIVFLVAILAVVAVWQRTLLMAATSPVGLELKTDGSVLVHSRGGGALEGIPAERRYVSRWLVVLELAFAPFAHRTILIARDMLPAEEFRHLRLWALWRALPATPAAAGA